MSKQPNENKRTGKRLFNFVMVLFVLALGIGIGTLISSRVGAAGPGDSQLQMQSDGKPVAGGAILGLSKAFEEAATQVEPSVVNINTEELVTDRRQGPQDQDSEDPMGELYRRFGRPSPQEPEEQMRRSLGSGVIVDPKGYIITNNHVVAGATKITVSVPGGDEYTARVVGADPISDIAVIKINGKKDFPFAKIGNSKNMKVGDWVIAIGSPFGFDKSVTAGIISATGRTFAAGAGPSVCSQFNDYLQTDASINHGNSGGPLVNMNAEVVGINTFISTPSDASAGVGFSVPSHLFVKVYNQILQTGKVSRGWVGMGMNRQPFTPAMAKYFGVKQGSGVLVTQLSDEKGKPANTGPAAKAGIKPEDVVIGFDGKKIMNNQDFLLAVADTPPGKKAIIKVVRQGQEKEFEVTLAERKLEEQEKTKYSFEEKEEKPKTEIGLSFDTLPGGLAESLNISGGAYVVSVKPGSLADDAGLVGSEQVGRGDVIVAANGKPINNPQDLLNIVKNLKIEEPVILKFLRVLGQDENRSLVTEINYTSIVKP
jgi:serine protease Do